MLRGWKGLMQTLMYLPDNKVKVLKAVDFQVLLLCDGQTDLEESSLTNEMQTALCSFEEQGVVERFDEPFPIIEAQNYKLFENRMVKELMWSVTGRCNFHCRHCYMDAPDGLLGEPSTEEALNLIDQMAECGVLRISLTGGEPLIRKDFWQIVDKLLECHICVDTIYTNGWLVNNRLLDEFDARGIKPEFSVSFDGVGWHDWMRGIHGAEEQALRALKLCHDRGFPTDVEVCLHQGNRNSLLLTIEKLVEVGVKAIRLGSVTDTELWKKNNEGYTYSFREYVEDMIDFISVYYEKKLPVCILAGGVVQLFPGKKDYFVLAERYDGCEKYLDHPLCGCAKLNCYISPEFRLLPCLPMTASKDQSWFPVIKEIGLKQGLIDGRYTEYVSRTVRDLLAVNKECAACPHKLVCGGGCRATALLESDHDLMGADREQCMLWNEGYVERIHKAADDAIAKYCRNENEA